ncbi:MAG: polysaccharide deacetylase family protein [Hyphomicrobium sp.]
MNRRFPIALAFAMLGAAAATLPAAADEACKDPKDALGVARIVEIDAKVGPLYGGFTKYEKEPRFLGPKEVVLTFDDGPMPKFTKPILDALDKFCTKATFFYVGQMAQAYPDMVKEVMGRGHTMGTHTWSHPLNLRALSLDRAKDQIERGFAAVALAAGQPIAPFFRFPGLSDSGPLLAHLQERGVAAFTVDVVSNDSYIGSPSRLAARTIAQVEQHNGGIVLFHDIKASTAAAIPTILAELKKRGYKVVHLRSKSNFEPLPALTAELEAKRVAAETKKAGKQQAASAEKPKLVPFYAPIALSTLEEKNEPEVTVLVPEAKERVHAGGTHATASQPVATAAETGGSVTGPVTAPRSKRHARKRKNPDLDPMSLTGAVGGRW